MGKIFYGLFATAISLSVALPCCAISESAVTTPYRIFSGYNSFPPVLEVIAQQRFDVGEGSTSAIYQAIRTTYGKDVAAQFRLNLIRKEMYEHKVLMHSIIMDNQQ